MTLVPFDKGWFGRSVSVGESKVCHMVIPWLFITRLPVLRREMVDSPKEVSEVDHTVDSLTSFKTKLPCQNDISDLCPLTGESRFSVHTMVLLIELVNQMEKTKAFVPVE